MINDTADTEISCGGIGVSPGNVSVTFDATPRHSLVSLLSMLPPSPDWFVGLHDLDRCEGNVWRNTIDVTLLPYDAGTGGGVSYTSPNSATKSREAISRVTTGPLTSGDQEMPVGTFTFVRQ